MTCMCLANNRRQTLHLKIWSKQAASSTWLEVSVVQAESPASLVLQRRKHFPVDPGFILDVVGIRLVSLPLSHVIEQGHEAVVGIDQTPMQEVVAEGSEQSEQNQAGGGNVAEEAGVHPAGVHVNVQEHSSPFAKGVLTHVLGDINDLCLIAAQRPQQEARVRAVTGQRVNRKI